MIKIIIPSPLVGKVRMRGNPPPTLVVPLMGGGNLWEDFLFPIVFICLNKWLIPALAFLRQAVLAYNLDSLSWLKSLISPDNYKLPGFYRTYDLY